MKIVPFFSSTENLAPPQILQELEVPIIDRKTCNNLYNISKGYQLQTDLVKADMICAGYKEGGKDACQVGYSKTFFRESKWHAKINTEQLK